MITTQQIQEILDANVGETEYFVVDVNVGKGNNILVEIDSPNGITVTDCVKVSRWIEGSFDREIEDFAIEVASPGLDKPLRVFKQYQKNIGRDLKVKTAEEEVKGELTAVSEEGITVVFTEKRKIEGKKKKEKVAVEKNVAFSDIEKAFVIVSFK